jgi:Cutinase
LRQTGLLTRVSRASRAYDQILPVLRDSEVDVLSHHHRLPTAALRLAAALTLAGASLAGATSAHAAAAPSSGCADVEVMVTRGTTESAPVGSMSSVAKAITSGTTKTVSTWGNPYPASANFTSSAAEGVTDLVNRMNSQAKSCPSQKFVLLGYSQGAWVVGDALAGGSFGGSAAVSSAVGAKVAAVVLWGNPRFNSAESFDVGTYTKGVNGTYPRAAGALKTYASRIQDYCVKDDTVCQSGASGSGHISYIFNSSTTSAGANFAVKQLAGTTAPPPVTTPTAGPTAKPTAAPIPAPTATTPAPVPTTTTPAPAPTGGWGGGWMTFWRSIFPWFS